MASPAAAPGSVSTTAILSGSPPSKTNETVNESATPPAPVTKSPPPVSDSTPPPNSPPPPSPQSPPPPQSTPPPPSNSPPPASPPPSPPPPSSPPKASSSPPPPPKSVSPPPSPQPNQPPPASPPPSPPPHDSDSSPSPPPPPPSTNDQSTPPPNSPPPPIFTPPPPLTGVVSPPPPPNSSAGILPPAQMVSPPMPKTPSGTPPPKPSTPTNDPGNWTTPTKPSPSTPSNGASNVNPSSTNADSSSSSPSSDGTVTPGTITAVIVALTILAAALATFAFICFSVSRKKKMRMKGLANQYRPAPIAFPMGPEGHYQNHATTPGNSTSTDLYYPSKTPSSPSPNGNSYGSCRGYVSQSGFSYDELMEITNGFSRDNVIGEGGFGAVYMGCLQDGRSVAVKQLKAGSGQGEREFRAEVEIISRVHHRHLVSLVGFCIFEHRRLLVYEFVPNKTLEYHLHGKELPALDWGKRMKIAIGSARGLAYLHDDCHPRIIHRDIKSANILLDNSFEAQVADFGLARLTNDANTHVSTRVVGTFGYMAPEYASSGKLTDRSDVYSFGVVLLELITGRKPVDPTRPLGDESLVEWARPQLVHALEVGECEELADPMLENTFVKSEMLRMIEVATACVRHSAPNRPRMVQVLRALDSEGDVADLSNGVKFGQSMVYNSSQYSVDIQKFRKMAFGSGESSSEYSRAGIPYSSEAPYSQVDSVVSRETSEYENSYSSGSHTMSGRAAP